MKRLFTSVLFVFLSLMLFMNISVNSAVTLEPLKTGSGSGYVKYRGTQTNVMIPTEYIKSQSEFRGVWVTPLASDISGYISDSQYKEQLLAVLDNMEQHGLNTIIFHVRIMNDALYDSDLNPKSSYVSNADFERWDYLEWFIDEVHSRGMEFHAWLNPYRITNQETTLNQVLSRYADYPQNPASKAENVIIGKNGAILNPGEPAVREFVIDTVMEVIEKYDVDAIHFDDYFYADMDANADQTTYNKYKGNSSTTNIADWRREQIDIFIQNLSNTMRQYNKTHNRQVQLGISPTGIYKNGNGQVTYDQNGTAITTGSNTGGQEHYASYLYANSKKWVDNEWIDYIIPQTYWGFEHPSAGYADVVDWWAKVVKYKKVNLYTGMGIYMRYNTGNTYSWQTNDYEASNQVLYNTKWEEVKGTSIYNYSNLKKSKNVPGLRKIVDEYWTNPAIGPEIRTMTRIVPGQVSNVKVVKNGSDVLMSWDPAPNAKRYAIYKSEGVVNVNDPTHLVKLIGPNSDGNIIFNDTVEGDKVYNYLIVAVSGTNTVGSPVPTTSDPTGEGIDFPIGTIGDIRLSGKALPDSRIQFFFDDANITIGTSPVYTFEISFDLENWEIIPMSEFRRVGSTYSLVTNFNEYGRTMYARVTVENNFGRIRSNVLEIRMQMNGISDYFNFTKYVLDKQIGKIIK